jgi:hypothetical protein
VTDLHQYIAYSIPTGFALLAVWAIVSFIRNKAPGDRFWNLIAVIQVILGVQIVIGGILFLVGNRPASNGPQWLHYAYGGLFPLALLIGAHRLARRHESAAWIIFGGAAIVIFGLTFRALQTGLGAD